MNGSVTAQGSRTSRSRRAGPLAFLAIALVLAGAAMILPWWTLSSTSPSGETSFVFGLTSLCVRPSGACTAYAPLVAEDSEYGPVAGAFAVAFGLASLALIAALLAFLLRLGSAKRRPLDRVSGFAGLAAAIAALAAPLYLFEALPSAFAASGLPYGSPIAGFFGGVSGSGITVSWGGSLGWGVSLAAFAFLLLASVPSALRRRAATPSPSP
ncbi:MAG: hypothetical protein E6K18_00520 [Methanobacteriota archaeon]|nr:MAG: hypothetical protein E6K18_00520 [Euryarchaeota archaeon]